MGVGILDSSGPAQFITADGLLGSPVFPSWPASLCLSHPSLLPSAPPPAGQQDVLGRSQLTVLTRAGSVLPTQVSGFSPLTMGVG